LELSIEQFFEKIYRFKEEEKIYWNFWQHKKCVNPKKCQNAWKVKSFPDWIANLRIKSRRWKEDFSFFILYSMGWWTLECTLSIGIIFIYYNNKTHFTLIQALKCTYPKVYYVDNIKSLNFY
jgi:hypothetical protein